MKDTIPSALNAQRAREDFAKFLSEIGFTEAQVWKITLNTYDQIPLPNSAGIELRPSPIHGLGNFSGRHYQPGEIIGPARIDAKRTPLGRYTNHSPTPNSTFIPQADGGIVMVARLSIRPGEEFTSDYRLNARAAAEADTHLLARPQIQP